MSVIVEKGMRMSYMETDCVCPICTFEFDCSEKADKAKDPMFKMRCPGCKSWVGIMMPIFGGTTKCFEWKPPKVTNHEPLETTSPFRVNGIIVAEKPKELFDDNSDNDEEHEIYV